MKKIGSIVVAAFAVVAAHSAAAVSPGEFVRAALAHSTEYQSAQASMEAAGFGVDIARAALLPQLRAAASRQLVPNRTKPRDDSAERNETEFSATLSQTLLDMNQFSTFTQAKHLKQAAGYQLRQIEQQVILSAYTEYLKALLAKANLSALQKRKQTIGQQLMMTEVNFELGAAETTLMDELTVRAQLAVIDAEQAETERRLEAAMLVLENMIGQRPARLHELAGEAQLDSEANWQQEAQDSSLAVLAGQESLQAALAAEDAIFALSLPKASLAASAFNHGEETVGIRIEFPLFSSGGASAGISRAQAQSRSAMLKLESARRDAKLAAADALVRIETQQQRIKLLAVTRQAQERRLEATTVLSESGKGVAFQVIDAASDLAEAEVALVAARHAKLLAVLSLKAAIGRLDAAAAASYDVLFAN